MRSAPSMLPAPVLAVGMKALRLAWTIIESGRETEEVACEPRRSSGSHNSCCMRFTPSYVTRGFEGNLRDCFQLRIFCRVTWRWVESKGVHRRGKLGRNLSQLWWFRIERVGNRYRFADKRGKTDTSKGPKTSWSAGTRLE